MNIDKEFQSLIPPLTAEEYAGLEESILSEGCRDALVVWGDTLIDGHNRYEICTKHGIPFDTVEMDFPTRDDVKLWMMRNQLARRNLNDMQRISIVRKCEDSVRAKAKERQGARTDITDIPEKFPGSADSRDELGMMAGVSGKTYEHAVTVLEKAPAPIVEATMRDALSINAAYQVTKMELEQQEEVAERIEHGEKPKEVVADVQKRPHVTFNSGNNEWYTPGKYIDLSREVLGAIDLDPARCEIANETVKAERFYSEQDDGLTKEWKGRVWMNPPYGSDLIGQFTEKFAKEYTSGNITEGIVLVNNATETAWFCNMMTAASAVVFPRGRIRYNSPTKESNAPIQGQAFIYFGEHYNRFLDVFREIGWGAVING